MHLLTYSLKLVGFCTYYYYYYHIIHKLTQDAKNVKRSRLIYFTVFPAYVTNIYANVDLALTVAIALSVKFLITIFVITISFFLVCQQHYFLMSLIGLLLLLTTVHNIFIISFFYESY